MIPRIIHYCWFGPGFMPKKHSDMVNSWKRILPDYTFMRWDESNFDIHCCEYTSRAYKEGKYAYVSDIARCKALLEYGGIYLDTDVELLLPLDQYLSHSFFTANEIYPEFEMSGRKLLNAQYLPKDETIICVPYFGLLSSIIGAEVHHPIINDVYNWYLKPSNNFVTIDGLLAHIATRYGYTYEDKFQQLSCGDSVIYPTGLFGYADAVNPNYSVSYHHNLGSWAPKTKEEQLKLWLERYYLSWVYKVYKKSRKFVANLIKRNRKGCN